MLNRQKDLLILGRMDSGVQVCISLPTHVHSLYHSFHQGCVRRLTGNGGFFYSNYIDSGSLVCCGQ